ncbi:uncharacterized protein METZ01_LOCUS315688 [marine metagenome]|uniref:Uncharacterized protein n=1 Tax=marine metagenome TaxID=408172 RepID=A0A382NNS2_9ZZZZ
MTAQNRHKARKGSRRRDKNKMANYGATLFHEVKRYDGDGNLIETVSADDLMARPIGATRKYPGRWAKRNRAASLAKTNGEGSKEAWNKVAAAVNRGDRVDYKKEKV